MAYVILSPAIWRRPASPVKSKAARSLEPDLAQYFRLVLAELRRAALQRKRALAHQDRAAHARRPLRLDQHAARDELRIGKQIGDRVDRPGRHDGNFECSKQGVAR